MRFKRTKNIPRQRPDDVQADAAAIRLGERHRITHLRIFDYARDCGVDLSQLSTEEMLMHMETSTLDQLLESGDCPNSYD